MTIPFRAHAVAAFFLCAASANSADLTLSGLYTDHMVIQREQPIKISGTSKPGDTVKVSLNDTSADAKADDNGEWQAVLPARKAGGPFTITIADSDETTSIKDVLSGDIWICSGQSNMAFQLSRGLHGKEAISNAANPELRLYKVPLARTLKPLSELQESAQWQVSAPETVPDFSAVGYYFGQKLQEELDVPIGLIHTAWGGTRVEWWTPKDGLAKFDYIADELKDVEAGVSFKALKQKYQEKEKPWIEAFRKADPGSDSKGNWAAADLDESAWKTVELPQKKNRGYLGKHDGTAWYRRTFIASEVVTSRPALLKIGCIDDHVTAYVNGKKIGDSKTALKPQSFKIPAGTLKAGNNIVTIQVLDMGKGGGICGDVSLAITGTDMALPLSGSWKFHAGLELADGPERPVPPHETRATMLYNAMIAPLQKLPIRGAIWYQGEGNAKPGLVEHYAKTFSTMISQWREGWDQGDFPFLFVQLASFRPIEPQPGESTWAELREQQDRTLEMVENTAMASAIDVGEQDDIHPRNKAEVGKRLALGALATEYGRDIEYTGPTYKSSNASDGKITVSFDHADGLETPEGKPLKGFAIAGADGKFVWADAKIEGSTVVVSSDNINEPKFVRYGWADYSVGNLYNKAGLPANPFRTDDTAK